MTVEIKSVVATVHGRVLVRPSEGGRLLVGFHGYGENAELHLKELESIPGASSWTLAAVQALHPFYVRSTQEVVASWMTRLDRDLAIADNLAYVANVVRELAPARPVVFAGFSQGAAMAWRAAAAIRCEGVMVLGGDIPPDIADPGVLPPALLARGASDSWYTAEKLQKDLSFLSDGEVESLVFEGGHEWTNAFRQSAGRFLARVARVAG